MQSGASGHIREVDNDANHLQSTSSQGDKVPDGGAAQSRPDTPLEAYTRSHVVKVSSAGDPDAAVSTALQAGDALLDATNSPPLRLPGVPDAAALIAQLQAQLADAQQDAHAAVARVDALKVKMEAERTEYSTIIATMRTELQDKGAAVSELQDQLQVRLTACL